MHLLGPVSVEMVLRKEASVVSASCAAESDSFRRILVARESFRGVENALQRRHSLF